MAEQMTFDLPPDVARKREDFFTSPSNERAVTALTEWEAWPDARMALIGPEGAGKSHLAGIWARDAGATVVEAGALAGMNLDTACSGPLCIEDADRAGADEPVLHAYNLMAERRFALLLTARDAPGRWPVSLPDLKSRLTTLTCARIEPPDDALLAALLMKLFHDRQLSPPPNLIAYALPRMERSFAAAQTLVATLDRLALTRRANITRSLVGEVLDNPDR